MLTLTLPKATSFAMQLIDDPKLLELTSNLSISTLAQRCSPARAREFLAGRVAAQRALAALGAQDCRVARLAKAPVWPAGFVGSISHCDGLAVAICARSQHYLALGIDIQTPIEPGAWAALQRFALSIDEWASCTPNPELLADLMSRKEAAWKCCAALGFNWPLPSIPAHKPLSNILPNAVLATHRCGGFSVSIAMLASAISFLLSLASLSEALTYASTSKIDTTCTTPASTPDTLARASSNSEILSNPALRERPDLS